jgi:hypothetical protein
MRGQEATTQCVIDLEHRLIGCYGVVGGSIAAADRRLGR